MGPSTLPGEPEVSQNFQPLKFSDITSFMDGKELIGMKTLWEDVATSETRINLISRLKSKKLGFCEIEKFSLGLKYSLKSQKMQEKSDKPILKVVSAAMELKLRDETFHLMELKKR